MMAVMPGAWCLVPGLGSWYSYYWLLAVATVERKTETKNERHET